jgi:hypothetical protein
LNQQLQQSRVGERWGMPKTAIYYYLSSTSRWTVFAHRSIDRKAPISVFAASRLAVTLFLICSKPSVARDQQLSGGIFNA